MNAQFSQSDLQQISVQDLATRLESGEDLPQLVDVREPEELVCASLPGFKNFPLSAFRYWSEDIATRLDPDAETLVLCHHGVRSAQMCYWLMQQGFTNVKNIRGGIDAYSCLVDHNVPQY